MTAFRTDVTEKSVRPHAVARETGRGRSLASFDNRASQKKRFPSFARRQLTGAELFNSYMFFIPLLWLLGVVVFGGVALLVKLVLERWPRGLLVNAVVLSWTSIGVSQACAALLNGIALHDLGQGLRGMIGFSVIGWILGAIAIAAGAAHRLDGDPVVRALARLGGYIIVLAALAALLRMIGLDAAYIVPTPLQMVIGIPDNVVLMSYTSVVLFQTEETMGSAGMRLVLFYPWTTGLGLGGLTVVFISVLDRDLRWRLIGVVGGVVAIVASVSRIAMGALVVVGVATAFLRLSRKWQVGVVGVLALLFFAVSLAGYSLDGLLQAKEQIKGARAGSSMARDLIYEKSWEGFLKSPIIGNGWVGESVHAKESLPIGSHSSIYGLAYTGGAPTLAAFCVALALTVLGLLYRYVTLPNDDPQKQKTLSALALGLCLVMYSPYEALYNLTAPCLYLFTWIGACLAAAPAQSRVTHRQMRHALTARSQDFSAHVSLPPTDETALSNDEAYR